jgi:hypothetical protein
VRTVPAFVHRHLTTIVVAAAVAAVTAGGPAVAATVVGYAKNAGAVDGISAVRANAPVKDLKGTLVATGAKTGTLPGSVIGTAPNSAKLGGVPAAGFASSFVDARDFPAIGKNPTVVCRTPLLIQKAASVGTVTADLTISVPSGSTNNAEALTVLEISQDGGSTFTTIDNGYFSVVEAGGDAELASVTHTTVAKIAAHAQVVFALGVEAETGTGMVLPSFAECAVNATVTPQIPGTVLRLASTPPVPVVPTRRSPALAKALATLRSAGLMPRG